jgi:hypothetical protein
MTKNATIPIMINVAKKTLILKTKISSGKTIKIRKAIKTNEPQPVKKSLP